MRLRWLAGGVLLVSLALEARADPADPPGQAPASALPPVSAGIPPAPAAVLELLPPGVRADAAGASAVERSGARGAPLREHLEPAASGEGGTGSLDVEYTLAPELQTQVRGVLASLGVALGHVIVMDAATGEVFAYVSTDPEAFPATRPYPTASLMKVVTAAATLDAAPAAASRGCRYVGSPYELQETQLEPPADGGRVDPFWRALAVSNNQCFARLAVHDLGETRLVEQIRRVGLLESPAARHAEGRVEPIEDALDLGQLGSGLAGSFITPLGAARLAAALAGGELVQPYWIARVRDEHGRLLPVPGRQPPQRIWSPEVTDALRALLVEVTEHGTARGAFHGPDGRPLLGPIRVAGKTGSLSGSDPAGLYQWFIGVAPAEAPRIAIAALVVSPAARHGGAAAVAAATLRELFCENGVCDASSVEPLHARADLREAADRTELAAAAAAAKLRGESPTRIYALSELDEIPRLLGDPSLDFPPLLRRRRIRGRIVVSVDLSRDGAVVDARIASSSLPLFHDFVLNEVRGWRFTPPTRNGEHVNARAEVPLQIRIR